MANKISLLYVLFAVGIFVSPSIADIDGSPHDLTAVGASNPCGFCHTPHGAIKGTPLWNHSLSTSVYTIYESSSLEANVGQPTGSSKLCLSCHDGTVALGDTVRGRMGGGTFIPPGDSNLGTDLSDDHPVSFVYSAGLSGMDPQILPPTSLPEDLKLDRSGELQCVTCHDPHDNQYGDFLVMSNQNSRMCRSCHDLDGWSGSMHEGSPAPTGGTSDSYLAQSQYNTVADNGCNCCHRPHSAGGHERLLHFDRSEENCLNCHNGSVASANIESQTMKISRHDVRKYDGQHDLKENPLSASQHVECVDCHNPHAVTNTTAQAPMASGALNKVTGISASGSLMQEVQHEYEVCFKCHSDNADRVDTKITRQIVQTNTRLEFDPMGPSQHPVISAGANPNVPSLITPLTEGSVIYCTDCHNTNDPSSGNGPHGSSYSPILAYNYETADYTQESEYAYQLCYQCHSRNSILRDESFSEHQEHLDHDIPCSACHDAHGISSAQGISNNNSHLINFDTNIVRADPATGRLEFIDDGVFRGRCWLTCHDEDHSGEDY